MHLALRRTATLVVSTFLSLSSVQCASRAPAPSAPALHSPQWEEGLSVLKRLEPQAQQCRQEGQPEGWALVRATFAGDGSVREVTVPSGKYARTPVADCVVALLRQTARIAPFNAQIVEVTVGITVGVDTAPPFDRGAAAQTLGEAAHHVDRGECGGHGDGHIKITFTPDGTAGEVLVDSPPGDAGVSACIVALFRECRMPPFSGSPVSVGKSVRIR